MPDTITSVACPFKAFGALVKKLRIDTGFTLQRFCAEFGYEHHAFSRLERGFVSPPSEDKLRKLAKDIGLWEGSDDWIRLFDIAAQCCGKLPPPGLTDEEVVKKLPLVFRTVTGERLSDDKLLEFAQNFRSM